MRKISDKLLIDRYINKYHIDEVFTKDMKSHMELLFYRKNEYMFKEGEPIEYLLFIVEGKAKVFTTVSNGKSLLLCFYPESRVLGDIEIFEGITATTNVQAIEDSFCIGISRENVTIHLLNDSKFLRFICSSLGQKLNRCAKNSAINLLYSLENRLASYILAASEVSGKNGSRLLTFNENLSELSELLGTSYRHLHRALNSLCGKGVIRKLASGYEITDPAEIRRLAADLYN